MLDSISFFRVIRTGFVNFWRNLWLSAAASMVMTVTLVIFATLFILFGLTSYSLKTVERTVDVSVYLKIGATEQQALSLKAELERDRTRVREVIYRSAEQVLAEFRTKHATDPVVAQAISELSDNPLPATVNVKATELSYYPQIAEFLKQDQFKDVVSKVNYEDNRIIIDRLGKILRAIVAVGIALSVIFTAIAVLVIFNTITLTIYNRREEVEIMRLVGATNWYIRGPFLVEATLYSAAATIATTALLWPVFHHILPRLALFVSPEVTVLSQNIFTFGYLAVILAAVALVLSIGTTILAIWRYLKI